MQICDRPYTSAHESDSSLCTNAKRELGSHQLESMITSLGNTGNTCMPCHIIWFTALHSNPSHN